MAGIEDFVAAPCEEFSDHCSKDHLFKIAEEYEEYELDLSSLSDKRWKEAVKAMVRLQLSEKGVLVSKEEGSGQSWAAQPFSGPSGQLTFEQQKELLLMQFSHEKERQMIEIE